MRQYPEERLHQGHQPQLQSEQLPSGYGTSRSATEVGPYASRTTRQQSYSPHGGNYDAGPFGDGEGEVRPQALLVLWDGGPFHYVGLRHGDGPAHGPGGDERLVVSAHEREFPLRSGEPRRDACSTPGCAQLQDGELQHEEYVQEPHPGRAWVELLGLHQAPL